MKRTAALIAVCGICLILGDAARADDDPFAGGADALAVDDSDGSTSLRAKKKFSKMTKDMAIVKVTALDDSKFPNCFFYGKVLKAPKSQKGHLKTIVKGKKYKFSAVLKMKGKWPDLSHKMTQNNLGGCYYGKKTKLVVKIAGVSMKKKLVRAGEIYLK